MGGLRLRPQALNIEVKVEFEASITRRTLKGESLKSPKFSADWLLKCRLTALSIGNCRIVSYHCMDYSSGSSNLWYSNGDEGHVHSGRFFPPLDGGSSTSLQATSPNKVRNMLKPLNHWIPKPQNWIHQPECLLVSSSVCTMFCAGYWGFEIFCVNVCLLVGDLWVVCQD